MRHRIVIAILAAALSGVMLLAPGSADAGGGCHGSGPNDTFSDMAQATVELGVCRFTPTVVRVAQSEQVTWMNSSTELHTVTGAAGAWGSDKELLEGDSIAYAFAESGVFPYFCALHPGMVGAVVVGDGVPAAAASVDGGVKAVSADAPGGGVQDAVRQPADTTGDRNNEVLIGVVVGVLLAAWCGRRAGARPGGVWSVIARDRS